MNRLLVFTISIVLTLIAVGCSNQKKHHGTDMPAPQTFNAHFGDMDSNGDGRVNWEEFSAHFENAEQKVFDAIDLNQDGNIDHDEWHEFKSAHGLQHHD